MIKKTNKRILKLLLVCILGCHLTSCATSNVNKEDPSINMINHFFLGPEEVSIKMSAVTIEGVFKGLKNSHFVDINDCSFSYSKGQGTSDAGEGFKYQTISILLSGQDQEGVDTFERLIYSNADLLSNFKIWNYEKTFGPVKLDESLKFGFDNKSSFMTFKKTGSRAVITFTHSDLYGTRKSKFFREGERRDYSVHLVYDKFTKEQVEMSQIIIEVDTSVDQGMGKFTTPTPFISAICSSFEKVDKLKD